MKGSDYGWTDRVDHCIDTGEVPPIQQPPRRLALTKQAEVDKMLKDKKPCGVIKESNSHRSCTFIFVQKNGYLHFCMDYRKLKDVMRKDVSSASD
jgi:hypothetical protein